MNTPIDQIFDENNADNIILFDENNEPVEFEQIAVVPLGELGIFTILKPANEMEGIAEDEALVFSVDEEEGVLEVVENEAIVDHVFEEYYEMLRENGIEVD